ncbi:hypothetical protein EYC80_003382 [Monilinia laxa]|uniref:Uncharacterized protein n=1 Tax=Monilinia laxa TaxID=61186 RepID=A0A5N6KDS8_MONLA|nr:hypothetical protein EYC80_003382 [Monilinia laxa]
MYTGRYGKILVGTGLGGGGGKGQVNKLYDMIPSVNTVVFPLKLTRFHHLAIQSTMHIKVPTSNLGRG